MLLKHLLLALSFPIAIAGCAPAISDSTPTLAARQIAPSFSSKPLGFALWLPVKPVEKQQSGEIGTGETATMHIFQSSTETVNYIVIAAPVPPSTNISDPKGQLDTAEKSMIATLTGKSPGANVQVRKDIQLGEFPGRELQISLLKGTVITRIRLYFTPKFFYQIFVGGQKTNVEKQSAQITKVLDSFRILPQ